MEYIIYYMYYLICLSVNTSDTNQMLCIFVDINFGSVLFVWFFFVWVKKYGDIQSISICLFEPKNIYKDFKAYISNYIPH